MLDWLEDEELDDDWGDEPESWQSPTLSTDELAWAAPDLTPLQEPKLSANEANHITKTLAAQATAVWLMTDGGREPATFAELVRRPEWQTRAACRGMSLNLFFPARGESSAAAKAVCASCEVRVECLDAAVADETTDGIWGGVGTKFAGGCGGGVRWRKPRRATTCNSDVGNGVGTCRDVSSRTAAEQGLGGLHLVVSVPVPY